MEKDKRISWVDISKGFGICFVVIGHVLLNDYIKNWLITFHMPLFLFLSGYLYKQKEIKDIIVVKARSMLIPYFYFSLLSIIYYWVIEYRFRSLSYSFTQSILGGVFCYIPYMNNAPLWYLPCAFLIVLLYRLLRNWFSSKTLLFVGILLNSVYWLLGFDSVLYAFPYELPRILDLFAYYSIGAFFATYSDRFEAILQKSQNHYLKRLILVVIVILSYASGFYLSSLSIYKLPIMSVLIAMVGILGTICLSCCFGFAIIRRTGKSTLWILCIHALIYRVIVGICSILLNQDSDMIRSNVVYALIIVIITILLCMFFEFIFRWGKKILLRQLKKSI